MAVICPSVNVIVPTTNTETAGTFFSKTFTQTGGAGTTTFSTSSSLPAGLTLSAGGVLSGTPTVTGTFPITVNAIDSNACKGTATYMLTINCQEITVTAPGTSTGAVGAAFSQTFTQTGGIGTITFSTASTLPTGITLSSSGVLSGTPTQSGTFQITVNAMDSNGCFGTMNHTMTIIPAAPPSTARIDDPLDCTGPGNLVSVTATVTNTNPTTQSSSFTATLTPALKALPASCTTNVGTCKVVNPSTITWAGTLIAGQTVTISYQAQVSNDALPGVQLCATSVATVSNSLPAKVIACGALNCQAAGPGLLMKANSPVNDQEMGSILIFNIYTSFTNAFQQNTRLAITNKNPSLPTFVHMFFVDGLSCSIADSYICLTQNQTASFLASDLDPGTTGYVIMVAVDSSGCPTNFNYLAGDEYVKFASGHAANLGAQAISAITGSLPLCNFNTVATTLNFDGVSYNVLPRVLAIDNIPSRADGNDTMLILNRIGGNLVTGPGILSTIFGLLYDDSESAISFGVTIGCQSLNSLSNTFPRTTPRFEQFIPAGHTGWLKVFAQSDVALTGAVINFNANTVTSAGAFNQGHNLHALVNTAGGSYTIPVFPPRC